MYLPGLRSALTVSVSPVWSISLFEIIAEAAGSAPSIVSGSAPIANWCIVAPVLETLKVTLPAFAVGVLVLTHISPSVTPTPFAAVAFEVAGVAAFGSAGACAVWRMPAAPRTMSPNECVTKG
jgi:hypothetical protein